MAYRRRANCRFVPTVVKIANADCVCSGAQRAPCRLAMIPAKIQRRKASRFVIARSEATWQSRSIRPDHRALPANTVTLRGMASRTPPSTRRVRSAIMPPNLGPARRSGNAATPHTLAFAILTAAGTGRRCLPEIAPQGHFLALRAQGATSAFGLLAMTRQGSARCTSALVRLNCPV